MGSTQSVQTLEDDEEEEDDDEEEEENGQRDSEGIEKKLLEQEPEMLPCYASASPLSPQLSSLGTPRMGPSIKVWDPYNVLAPPPPPLTSFGRSYSSEGMVMFEDRVTEVYLISNGESEMSLRQDLIGGRCPNSGLTANGKRQARALSVFLNSQGVRFIHVYSSPLDRAKSTAISVCQEMSFPEEDVHPVDALSDMSHGHWEGCPISETYTPEILSLIDRLQPDFSAPSGESLRQVEFRMVEFLRGLLILPNPKLNSDRPNNNQGPQWDLLYRHHRQLLRKKSGKSRLQVVVTNNPSPEDEPSSSHQTSIDLGPTTSGVRSSSSPCVVGVFSHSVPIKCLLTGILGCSPIMSSKLCIEDSSVTVMQHSWRSGWQIKRLNETSHLRLL